MTRSRKALLTVAALAMAGTAALAVMGVGPATEILRYKQSRTAAKDAKAKTMPAPSVSVVRAVTADFAETVLVTGTIVPREEILVTPEVDGLRILEVLADEGQEVRQGDVLARVERETIDAQIAQNAAQLARTGAAIEQMRSSIVQAEWRLKEAKAAFERAKPLRQSGYLSESTFDQRETAARSAEAQLAAARDGLKLAEAEKAQIEAQGRELAFRRGRTEIKATSDGIVSRRSARIGAIAAAGGEPMFRLIAGGEFELYAEVTETRIAKRRPGQTARIEAAGAGVVTGKVRLVSPEVDKLTRLGRVRITIGRNAALKVGAFARGTVVTANSRGVALPASAILYSETGASVQVVAGTDAAAGDKVRRVETRRVETGLVEGGQVEIRSGIADGDAVVARAGSFLRDGDVVVPVLEDRKVSEAGR